jgi:hypothetical protein
LDKGQHVIAGKPVIGPAGKAYAFSYDARQAPPLRDVIGTTVLTAKAKYWASLQTLMDNYLIKAVIGKVDTDKGFDDFKVSWLKSGGQELTDEANKVYAQRQKK